MSARRSITKEVKAILYGSASVLAGLGMAVPVHAQETGDVMEEVVVTGIRSSYKQSLETKRQSVTIVDAITSEDIGKFPDKNVAESLQRVPGVSIQRDFGEGEKVAIRGTAPNLNLTLLNGHAVATGDWFVLDLMASTRSFNYLLLPSEIVSSIEVHKSPSADLEEGGIGGTINVRTRNPLDLPAFTLSASALAAYSELADETDPQATGLFSWKNSEETFGVLVAGFYQERHLRRDGVELLDWSDRGIADQEAVPDGDPSNDPVFAVPDLIGSAFFTQERIRQGGNFGIQFRPSDNLEFNLTGLYAEMEADNFNQNYLAFIRNKFGAGEQPTNTVGTTDGTLVAGTFANTSAAGIAFDGILRDARTETESIDLDMNFAPNDAWSVHGKIGYTYAEGATDAQPFWEPIANTGFTWDFSGGVPEVSFPDIADPTAPNSLPALGWSSHNQFLNEDEEFYLFGDLEWKVDMGAFTGFKFGAKFTEHERNVEITYGQTRGFLTPTGCGGGPCGLSQVAGQVTPSDYLEDIAAPGTFRNFRLMNPDAIAALYGALDFVTYDPNNPQHVSNWFDFNIYHLGPLESYTINEETYGGYAMGLFEGEGWRGNLGVRIVQTEQTSDGWAVGVPPGTPNSQNNPFGLIAPISIDHDYSDVLPSVNLAFDLTDEVVLRFAAARVMARADYNRIAPTITSTTPLTLSGTGGNPLLDPYRADQFDVTAEWYFAPESMLSVALFYKDIQAYLAEGTGPERLPTQIVDPNDGRLTDPAADCQPSGTPDLFNCIYQIDRPVNGSGGHNQGAEIIYQQPIWGGFGTQLQYTYSDASAANGEPIPSNSEHATNVTAYYENQRVSARLSYNYRSDFFIGLDRGRPFYSDKIESLDVSFGLNVTDNIILTFEGLNVTDEELFQYYDNNEGRPGRFYDNAPVYYAGVRINLGR